MTALLIRSITALILGVLGLYEFFANHSLKMGFMLAGISLYALVLGLAGHYLDRRRKHDLT